MRETAARAADGVTLDVEEVHLFAFDTNGLIAALWDIPADPDTQDALIFTGAESGDYPSFPRV